MLFKRTLAIVLMTGMIGWATSMAASAASSVELDAGLEAAVREQIALNADVNVSVDEVRILTDLYIGKKNPAKSLEGLQNASFLKKITVDQSKPLDLTAITQLPSLTMLEIREGAVDKAAEAVIATLREKGVSVQIIADKPAAALPIQVFLDGKPLSFTKDPILMNGTTLVQFRPLFESFGLEVGWDNDTRTVTGEKEKLLVKLAIGSKNADVSGTQFTLPVAPMLMDGNTMVPLRFIGEATGRRVLWDEDTRTIHIDQNVASFALDIIYSNKTVYEGETVNGIAHGKGKLFDEGILFYEGHFNNGVIEGYGKLYDGDNPASYYEGDFHNNRFHGKGKLIYDDGSYHEGEYSNGLREGNGKLAYSDGTLAYEGMFQYNAVHGEGISYSGDYKYIGSHKLGAFHGYGELYNKERLLYEGEWELDMQIRGKLYIEDRLWYEGTLWNDSPDGYGTFYDDHGNVDYRGQVRSYQRTGVGILYYENGDRYVGEVYNGLAEGKGILQDSEGIIQHDGFFIDGEIDSDPQASAGTTDRTIKQLMSKARHGIIDGFYENNVGLGSTQAMMFIALESEEHVELFNQLPEEAKARLINEYAQGNWGSVLGVEECFTFVVFDKYAYAEATLSYEHSNEDVELTLYPQGKQIFE